MIGGFFMHCNVVDDYTVAVFFLCGGMIQYM